MRADRRSSLLDLSTWIDSRQSQGLYYFTREEALSALKYSEAAFKHAAARLARKKRIARIRSGFFIIIPLEYAATGILPPEWFIADLMDYIGKPYYVGGLSAAVLHGAAHQQPQQFHVVSSGPLREVRSKGLSIRFFTKKGLTKTPQMQVKVQTGFIPVSTPEATALDLIRYSKTIGGMERVLTVLQELGEVMDPSRLVEAANADGTMSYAQRLGFLLEKAEFTDLSEKLLKWVNKKKLLPAKLEPSLSIRGCKRDNRWMILVNADLEGDL